MKAGRLAYTDASWNTNSPNIGRWLESRGVSANHIHHINARNSEGKTRLELASQEPIDSTVSSSNKPVWATDHRTFPPSVEHKQLPSRASAQ